MAENDDCRGCISRRKFCAATGASLLALSIGCDPTASPRVSTGGIDDSNGNGVGGVGSGGSGGEAGNGGAGSGGAGTGGSGGVGGSGGTAGTGGTGGVGGSGGTGGVGGSGGTGGVGGTGGAGGVSPSCTPGKVSCGAASGYSVNTPKRFTDNKTYDFYVVKDSGGFYTVDTACTHEGVTLVVQGSQFYCPRHSATFDLNGKVLSGPPNRNLQHYAVCVDAAGNVTVDYTTDASSTQRF